MRTAQPPRDPEPAGIGGVERLQFSAALQTPRLIPESVEGVVHLQLTTRVLFGGSFLVAASSWLDAMGSVWLFILGSSYARAPSFCWCWCLKARVGGLSFGCRVWLLFLPRSEHKGDKKSERTNIVSAYTPEPF